MATTYKYIASVIKTSSKETSPGTIDPGFNVLFHTVIPLTGEVTPIQLLETEILNNATATIEAQLNDKFEVEIKIEGLKKLKVSETFVLSGFETDALRQANFKFNLHYFPLTTGARSAHIVNYLNENGGIRLYRNGFSVAPYGEKYNDWLGLDDSARRRKILAPHANLNFIGSAEILDVTGKIFDETSSREGLINNDAFKELRDALYQIVIEAVKRITSARGKKVTASQQGYLKENQTIEEKLDSSSNKLLEDVRKLNVSEDDTSTDDNSTNLDLFSDEVGSDSNSSLSPSAVAQSLKETLEEQQQYIQELIDEKNMYRVLSSTGLAIAEFTHEIQLYLDGLMLSGKQLKRLVDDNNEALDSVGKMDSNIDMLVSYTDFFTETIRNNSQRQKNPIEIRDVFKAFFDAMRPTIERRSYMLDISFQGDEFWTRPMHISELSSVLMNLFTNACKAIIRSGQPNGRLKVQVTSTDDDHIIRFEDNGDGIPKENWGRVFNALFTTELSQGVYASESEQMKGMGLGLTITQDIIYGLDGDISVVEPSVGYKTCIEIVLPKAKENEIPEDAY
ncbi:sensor histidine kinase [Vibrio cyclitrophicus]|uniref:histidine kinase n=2 Tax=Vibrio cyclitrophicus TaxID=47951 RepID=A0A7Z1S1L2_9VIBR|nr:HAMP domain-containing sensor histidine kinase [Vibrio cyclitrophicus]PMP18222.1 hypothetical protein BCS91_24990 [Vibrio cyclitrophicus]PMP25276.1 hypothetical protein BCS90_24740 [Vibrio cyclitrophicus]